MKRSPLRTSVGPPEVHQGRVTEQAYSHELRPVMHTGAQVMDSLFGDDGQKKSA